MEVSDIEGRIATDVGKRWQEILISCGLYSYDFAELQE
jgi:hypothetical protein